ncbi:unannotated protein [freshwater metagenome]|uniref:Unannotated protein n=1 Tax=freshwater metagenome TaxID=449393 RepID=A0A6J7EMM9_9ZZZZ|nr:hypothetical protein [Actinomycetota bacterium]
MIIRRVRSIAIATIFLTATTATDFADAAGRKTTAPVNTILNGKGSPNNSLGINGDFYIDTRSLLLYGPKSKGKWPAAQSIQGPTGPSGSDGKNGLDGKVNPSANINTVAGPVGAQGLQGVAGQPGVAGQQGPQGLRGEKGEVGATGVAGSSGVNGATGATGLVGATGLQGIAGVAGAQGLIGATGLTGTKGEAGTAGSMGITGPSGAKGETGTAGPSEVAVVDIPAFTLGTSVGFTFASSELFGTLTANSSYKFDIYLRSDSNLVGAVLGLDIVTSGGSILYSYLRSDSRIANYSSAPASYGFFITGTIRVGSTNSNLLIRIIDGYGDTGASPLIFKGKAYITLVGAIR